MEVPFDGRVPPPGERDAVARRLRGAFGRPAQLAVARTPGARRAGDMTSIPR